MDLASDPRQETTAPCLRGKWRVLETRRFCLSGNPKVNRENAILALRFVFIFSRPEAQIASASVYGRDLAQDLEA